MQEEIVKLQILNLAVKLFLTNPEQTKLLCQYVLTLARYDQNYDIRDRSRLLRQILFPQNENSKISEKASEIFLANKPAPLLVSKFIGEYIFCSFLRYILSRDESIRSFVDREEFQMGSLSHYINARAHGYQDLPGFPETPSDPSVRNVPTEPSPKIVKKTITDSNKKSFYSDSDNSSPAEGEYYFSIDIHFLKFGSLVSSLFKNRTKVKMKMNRVTKIAAVRIAKIPMRPTTMKRNL